MMDPLGASNDLRGIPLGEGLKLAANERGVSGSEKGGMQVTADFGAMTAK